MKKLFLGALCTLLLATFFFLFVGTGKTVLPYSKDYTGHYYGLNLIDASSILGKKYYRVTVDDGICGYWFVLNPHDGYNAYKGFYESGVLKEEGEIYVEFVDYPKEPLPDRHKVRSGKYYTPDGVLGSLVENGTGCQKLWYPNGQLRFELELKDYKRVRLKQFSTDGSLVSDVDYGADSVPVH
ncbi:MAG: hypothetical protein ACRC46_06315 [Thermoguttaceae bacterium]